MNKIFKLFINQRSDKATRIKKNVKKLHKINTTLVPQYLDSLKKNLKVKETDERNEYLKYM